MPRREWSRPFGDIKYAILELLNDGAPLTSDDLAARTGLPFEDVIAALRLLRHSGEIEFEPVWASPDEMSGARQIRLAGAQPGEVPGPDDAGESRP